MTEPERQEWERERIQGRDRFILRGLFRKGFPFAAVFVALKLLLDRFTHAIDSPFSEARVLLATFLLLLLGGGWGEGARIWYKREREYLASSS